MGTLRKFSLIFIVSDELSVGDPKEVHFIKGFKVSIGLQCS